jgi:hypothetical protein
MNRPQETAVSLRRTHRETRDPLKGHGTENPFARIQHSGTASDKFQVLRSVRTKRGTELRPWGAFVTLDEAITARDVNPIEMHSQDDHAQGN